MTHDLGLIKKRTFVVNIEESEPLFVAGVSFIKQTLLIKKYMYVQEKEYIIVLTCLW